MIGSYAYASLPEATARHPLAPARGLYSSDSWLELLREHGHQYRWLLMCARERAAALAPVTDGPAVQAGRYRPGFLLDERLPAERCVVAGPRTGYLNELRYGPERLPAAEVAEGLLAGEQRERPPGAALLPYLPSGPAAAFETAGHPAGLIAWDAWLDVPGTGFDGYLSGLEKTHRNQVKDDLRRYTMAGVAFSTRPLTGPDDEISDLLVLHERMYGTAYDRPGGRFSRYLARCAELPGAYVVRARLAGRTVGCHLVFHYRDVLWVRLIGVDESRPGTRGCYFGLMFYEPLRLAHELGARAVHLGIGTSRAKARRGARLEPLWTVAVTAEGRVRDLAREGLAARARDLPDPAPEADGPVPESPSAWQRPSWAA
ncbi:GNAT family N-acetyltransferase [Streptomyces roseoverticillatus]|uniref:GNAT family N-acetyltransferase n=1 Tax=Streptomyces roseoverticillatus TaxID=66429 RepID=A0ABV3J599_9ACTN